jgi:TRAP-type C4-dicarboxylate transport system permease small subunit
VVSSLVVVALVAVFVLVAGVAGWTVWRLWSAADPASGVPAGSAARPSTEG